MIHLKALCLLIVLVMAASLYSLPPIEVYIQHPDSFEKAFLGALENTISSGGDFTLDHSYRDSDFDSGDFNDITFSTVDDTSEMGYLVFLKALKLQGTGTPQVAVSLYHTIQGMLFYSEIMQIPLGTPQSVAEAVYREKLMFFHPLVAPMYNRTNNAHKEQLRTDIQQNLSSVLQYWLTPISQGGAGQNEAYFTKARLNEWLGFPRSGGMVVDSGILEIIYIDGAVVQIKGTPRMNGSYDPDNAMIGVVDCNARNTYFMGK